MCGGMTEFSAHSFLAEPRLRGHGPVPATTMAPAATPWGDAMAGLEVTQIDHVSVLITDLEVSRRFYRDVLGLKEIAKPRTFDFKVLWFDLGNQQLHLLLKPEPDTISPRHFALRVKDARAAREYLRARGIPTRETTPIPHCDRFFIDDPAGNRIEIIQWLRPYEPAESGAATLDGTGG